MREVLHLGVCLTRIVDETQRQLAVSRRNLLLGGGKPAGRCDSVFKFLDAPPNASTVPLDGRWLLVAKGTTHQAAAQAACEHELSLWGCGLDGIRSESPHPAHLTGSGAIRQTVVAPLSGGYAQGTDSGPILSANGQYAFASGEWVATNSHNSLHHNPSLVSQARRKVKTVM